MSALTSVGAVKAYLGITTTTTDSLLSDLVDRASAAIENFCQRTLAVEDRTDITNGNGSSALLLRNYPVVSVSAVTVDGNALPANSFSVAGRMLVLTGYRFTRGIANVRVDYSAGYNTIPSDVEGACIEIVSLMFKRREHIDVSSKSLAGETISFITSDMTPSARQILQNYRIVAPL